MERRSVVRVELNMSWWVLEDQGGYDDFVHAIHEVGEYEGVRGGGLSRTQWFNINYFIYKMIL